MAPEQEDRGVEPGEDILNDAGEIVHQEHVLDATGRPAKAEDDLASD